MRHLLSLALIMLTTMAFAQTPIDKLIVKEVIVNAPVEKVWYSWTDEKGLTEFMAQGAKIEMRMGGAYEIYFSMEEPEGHRGSEGCTVLSFVPNEMLSFTWNAPPKFADIRKMGPPTFVVLQFFPVDKTHTRVKLTHGGWYEGGEWPQVYNYFDAAWGKVLTWLKESYEKPVKD